MCGAKLGLKTTSYFHVEKMGDGKWALVDPAGNLFIHLGICGMAPGDDFTLVAGRESAYASLPPHDGRRRRHPARPRPRSATSSASSGSPSSTRPPPGAGLRA
jgi:hypothetical protein